jgi:hypothetical protein
VGVRGRCDNNVILSLQFYFETLSGERTNTPMVGGEGGKEFNFKCPEGEYI